MVSFILQGLIVNSIQKLMYNFSSKNENPIAPFFILYIGIQ